MGVKLNIEEDGTVTPVPASLADAITAAAGSASAAATSESQSDADAIATAADRVQTGLDRTSTSASAAAASASAATATAEAATALANKNATSVLTNAALKASLEAEAAAASATGLKGAAVALAEDYTDVFAIDILSEETNREVVVKDSVTPANDFIGNMDELLLTQPTVFYSFPKIVTLADGSIGWSAHNNQLQSESFNSWANSNITIGSGEADPLGGVTATLFTASASATCNRSITNAFGLFDGPNVATVIFKLGSGVPYVNIVWSAVDHIVYFPSGVVGTADGALQCSIVDTFEDNVTLLPAGWLRAIIKFTPNDNTIATRIGVSDADGALACTSGKTVTVFRAAQGHGSKTTRYLATTITRVCGAVYDWQHKDDAGNRVRGMLIEATLRESATKWGSDFTQALWVKTGCTAAFDAVGLSGEACSTLTATTNNATVLQEFTPMIVDSTFQVFIKRSVGTGQIFMTMDDGATYTDITSQLIAGEFVRVFINASYASLATTKFGFKLAVSGDAIIVEYAHVQHNDGGKPLTYSPFATYSNSPPGYVLQTGDNYYLDLSSVPTSNLMSLFLDFAVGEGGNSICTVGLTNTANTESISLSLDERQQHVIGQRINSVASAFCYIADFNGSRVSGALRLKANSDMFSIYQNGGNFTAGFASFTPTKLRVGGYFYTQTWIFSAVLVPQDIDDEIRLWNQPNIIDSRYLDDMTISIYKEIAQSSTQRFPAITVLSDTHTEARGFVLFGSRALVNYSEGPVKILAAPFIFNKQTNKLSRNGANITIFEPSGWATGIGFSIPGCVIKQRGGTNKGRTHIFFSNLKTRYGMSYAQSGTPTITIDYVGHGFTTGQTVEIWFTKVSGVGDVPPDNAYVVTVVNPNQFTATNPSGSFTSDGTAIAVPVYFNRSTYIALHSVIVYCYSDNDLQTISSPIEVYDPGYPNLSNISISGDIVELPQDDPFHSGRIIVPVYNEGVTGINIVMLILERERVNPAQVGATLPSLVYHATEPNLAYRPNGQLVLSARVDDVPNSRVDCVSSDGGDTWTAVEKIAGSRTFNGTYTQTGTDEVSVVADGHDFVDGDCAYMTFTKTGGAGVVPAANQYIISQSVAGSFVVTNPSIQTSNGTVEINRMDTTNCNIGIAQCDIDNEGGLGKVLVAMAAQDVPFSRINLSIRRLLGKTKLSYGEDIYRPLGVVRSVGYTSARALRGGYLLVAYESSQLGASNNDSSIRLMALNPP